MSFKRAFRWLAAIYVLVALLIFSGLFDGLSTSGLVNHGVALFVLTLYLALATAALWVAFNHRRFRSQLLLVFGGIVLALIAAEIVIRQFHPAGAKLL